MKYGHKKFILIPKEIIYQPFMDKRRILLFSYLCCRCSIDNTIAFSINELCQWSHVKPNRQPGKINERYMSLLAEFGKMGYFSNSPDFSAIKNINEYHQISYNEEKTKHGVFGMIYLEELQDILNLKESGVYSYEVLLLLSYLRVNIKYGADEPQCCYRLYKNIASDIGLNERNIKKVVSVLEALKIIISKELPIRKFTDDCGVAKFITQPKIFADCKRYDSDGNEIIEYNCDAEIEKQIKLISSKENS